MTALGLLWLLAFAGVGDGGGPGPASPQPGWRRDAAPVAVAVSEQELSGVSEQLYGADGNRAGSGDIVLRLQHRIDAAETRAGIDYAAQRLFSYVAEERLFSRPTFSRFLALLDNYEEVTGHNETVTAEEEEEEEAFLDAIFQTRVMATLTSFFLAKGLYPSEEAFRADLKEMWFGLYSRSGGKALDSSGFEHVFHGELRRGKVSGGHSWVQLHALERSGRLNYLSYSYDGPWATFPDVLALQYRWSGHLKSIGSTFMGSSPEFDLALYTLCYKTRPDHQCRVSLGGKAATIQTYSWANSFYGDGRRFVASSYPLSP
ncbi:uridylate-specific endoribonuclease C-like isoform X2 [Ciconia boyciana]|uniref:uridylate-specific endoribonuclease C-like isoform X2 n=1 Tax=Ciconia boyciana TaxID=52775 RepID=UPI003BA166C0